MTSITDSLCGIRTLFQSQWDNSETLLQYIQIRFCWTSTVLNNVIEWIICIGSCRKMPSNITNLFIYEHYSENIAILTFGIILSRYDLWLWATLLCLLHFATGLTVRMKHYKNICFVNLLLPLRCVPSRWMKQYQFFSRRLQKKYAH